MRVHTPNCCAEEGESKASASYESYQVPRPPKIHRIGRRECDYEGMGQ
jgi:hypothetical protein